MLKNADILADTALRLRNSISSGPEPKFYRTPDGTIYEVSQRNGVQVISVEDVH